MGKGVLSRALCVEARCGGNLLESKIKHQQSPKYVSITHMAVGHTTDKELLSFRLTPSWSSTELRKEAIEQEASQPELPPEQSSYKHVLAPTGNQKRFS